MKQVKCEFHTSPPLIYFCSNMNEKKGKKEKRCQKKKKKTLSRANWSVCFEELNLEIEVTWDFVLRIEFFELHFRFFSFCYLSEL